MLLGVLLFKNSFVEIVTITFTALILSELLNVSTTVKLLKFPIHLNIKLGSHIQQNNDFRSTIDTFHLCHEHNFPEELHLRLDHQRRLRVESACDSPGQLVSDLRLQEAQEKMRSFRGGKINDEGLILSRKLFKS